MTDTTTPSSPIDSQGTENAIVPVTSSAAEPGPGAKALAFVKKHPVLTVAGGIAIGVAASALLPRKTSRKVLGRAIDLASKTGAATLLAGHDVVEKAEKHGISARKQAGFAAGKAEEYGEKAADRMSALGLAALAAATAFGKATASKAEQIGDAAADRSGRIVDLASEVRKRIGR